MDMVHTLALHMKRFACGEVKRSAARAQAPEAETLRRFNVLIAVICLALLLLTGCKQRDLCAEEFIITKENFSNHFLLSEHRCDYVSLHGLSQDSVDIVLSSLQENGSLATLSFKRCRMNRLPKDIGTFSVANLSIEGSSIQEVDLADLPVSIENLSLANNKLQQVSGRLPHLRSLDLSNNELLSPPCLMSNACSDSLRYLNVSNNRIERISPEAIPTSIKGISAYGNPLKNLHELHEWVEDSILIVDSPYPG